jgi:hypothetical protein
VIEVTYHCRVGDPTMIMVQQTVCDIYGYHCRVGLSTNNDIFSITAGLTLEPAPKLNISLFWLMLEPGCVVHDIIAS